MINIVNCIDKSYEISTKIINDKLINCFKKDDLILILKFIIMQNQYEFTYQCSVVNNYPKNIVLLICIYCIYSIKFGSF